MQAIGNVKKDWAPIPSQCNTSHSDLCLQLPRCLHPHLLPLALLLRDGVPALLLPPGLPEPRLSHLQLRQTLPAHYGRTQ